MVYSNNLQRKTIFATMKTMNELLNIAIRAALEAGDDIMNVYEKSSEDFGIEYKEDHSPLTRADKAAHKRIISFLEPTGIPVLSEEGAHLPYSTRRAWKRLWIVDPLDGTKEFIKRNGEFTVNIALIEGSAPILGVIYVPVKKELYFGIQPESKETPNETLKSTTEGGGAWKTVVKESTRWREAIAQGVRLPSENNKERAWTCVASRSHLSPETEAYIEELRKVHNDLQLISSGSSLKICLVAEGKADVYPRHAPTMEWDTAAGDAIARASGCCVVNANTNLPLIYNKEDLHNPWFIVRR